MGNSEADWKDAKVIVMVWCGRLRGSQVGCLMVVVVVMNWGSATVLHPQKTVRETVLWGFWTEVTSPIPRPRGRAEGQNSLGIVIRRCRGVVSTKKAKRHMNLL